MNKSKTISIFFLILAITFSLPACKTQKEIKQMDAKQTSTTKQGEKVVIEIKSNITTGYQWEIIGYSDKSIVELEKAEYVADQNEKMMAGAGGKQVFTFKTLKKGNCKVAFENKRLKQKEVGEKMAVNIVVE